MFDGYLIAGHALEIRRRSPKAILLLLTVSHICAHRDQTR